MHKKIHWPLIFGTLFSSLLISSQPFAAKGVSFNDFTHGKPQPHCTLFSSRKSKLGIA